MRHNPINSKSKIANSKKAIELSLNFIIVIILSVVIFGFGIQFVSKLFLQGQDLTKMTESQLDSKIQDIICSNSERVCVAGDQKVIRRKELDVFAVKIFNILETQTFTVNVNRANPQGYKKDRTVIPGSSKLTVLPTTRNFKIEQNTGQDFAIGVQVPSNAISGTYIFDVKILAQDGTDYTRIQKLYVEVP